MAFIKDPRTKKTLWLPAKPKSKSEVVNHKLNSPEKVKSLSTDKKAAEAARKAPSNGHQTFLEQRGLRNTNLSFR